MTTKRTTTGRGSIVNTGEKLPTRAKLTRSGRLKPYEVPAWPSADPHSWAREMVARMKVGPVLAVALLRGGIEVLTDDPERRAALRVAIEASDAALPSIAWDLAELAHAAHAAADTLGDAARASERGDNDTREALIRKAREALRAVLANDTFTLAPEVSK